MPRLCIGSNALLGDLISVPTKTVHLVKHKKDATGTNTGTNVNDNTNDNANINASDKAVLLSVGQVSIFLEEGLDWEEHDYQLQLHQQSNANANANANGNVQPESPVVLNISDDGIPLRCTAPSPVPTPNSNNNGNNNGDRGSESDTDDSSDDDDNDDNDGMVSTGSILGIHENQSLFSARRRKNEQGLVMKDEKDLTLHLEVFRPNLDTDAVVDANTDTNTNIANHNPHCDWTRRPRKIVSNANANDDSNCNCNYDANGTSSLQVLPDAKMRLFDLTNLQNHRMQKNNETNMSNGTHNGTSTGNATSKQIGTCKHDTGVGTDNINFQIDSPGYICHLLRSILQYSYSDADTNNNDNDNDENNIDANPHFASPWSSRYYVDTNKNTNTDAMNTNTSKTSCYQTDLVIGILLKNQLNENNDSSLRINLDDINLGINNTSRHKNAHKNNHHWNTLEKRELTELSKFRTGDACPSFYLYSMSKLRSDFNVESLLASRGNDEDEGVVSEVLEHANENNINENGDSGSSIRSSSGYTLFVYRQMPPRDHFVDQLSGGKNVESYLGCLLEEKRFPTSNPASSSSSDEANYRIVAPPYQSHEDVYPGLMKDLFLNPEILKLVTLEAQKIPQWTAWPEKNHYQSEYDNNTDLSDNAYPASWTVFPLCHTFPATDISARKWIGKTCALVPQTTALLKALGPMLRTALFSRLEPRTTLELHTGWADLANHVLRVHIPLVVPSGGVNTGLCGTWVDGCVETHKEGEIICFDDSKTHRAFNYSDEERIVLIVDLARPSDQGFPEGTACGGYTNELDAFIKQFS